MHEKLRMFCTRAREPRGLHQRAYGDPSSLHPSAQNAKCINKCNLSVRVRAGEKGASISVRTLSHAASIWRGVQST